MRWIDKMGLSFSLSNSPVIPARSLKRYLTFWLLGGLDNYLLFTKPSKIQSQAGLELREVLIKKWEEKHKQKFNRRKILFQERLQEIEKKKLLKNLAAQEGADIASAMATPIQKITKSEEMNKNQQSSVWKRAIEWNV